MLAIFNLNEAMNYKDNPDHYKRLISQINEEANFSSYLINSDYKLLKKSAGSMEFVNNEDRIVLLTSRSPISYFNRNNSEDKGLFFKFLRNRESNFYATIKTGLEVINRSYENDTIPQKVVKVSTNKKSLEDNYNIVPLRNPIYLTKERLIAIETLNSDFFKGKIYNAFHHNDNGSKIANVAFPKFDLEGVIKNYILYNRPYKDRNTGTLKKFKLVLNNKDHFLFHSNFPKNGVKRIIFGESGNDLLSFCELKAEQGDFYVSFGGNVYKEKLDFFYQLIQPIISDDKVALISIMDNDVAGHQYDLTVFSKLINELNANVYFETSFKNGIVTIKIHYNEGIREQISIDNQKLETVLKTFVNGKNSIENIVFADKLLLEFSLPKLIEAKLASANNTNEFNVLMLTLNKLYLHTDTQILKSKGKDWNQDLIDLKKKAIILK